MTNTAAERVKADMIRKGYDHVVPEKLEIIHPQHGTAVVPVGMCFDGSTVVLDTCLPASARHDYLYVVGEINGQPISRQFADQVYRDTMFDWGWNRLAKVRYFGLRYTIAPYLIWRRSRKMNWRFRLASEMMLPEPENWDFPNWMVKNAIYHKAPTGETQC